MKQVLHQLFEQKVLNTDTAKQILTEMASGKYNSAQMTAFLTAFCMRNISVEELTGFRDAMIELCLPIHFEQDIMDIVGTGGDGKDTFNISTLASFVVAGAGYHVAKHGNYGVSSNCGSSNVMEYLGYKFTANKDILSKSLDKAHICFLHAPLFHPAMKVIAPIRKDLGVKTFFNMLGPLVNPAKPKFQLLGVFSLELARIYHYISQESQSNYSIIYALDGYDEISLTGPFKVFNNRGERFIELRDIGFDKIKPEEISGGKTIADSADIFLKVLKGEGSSAQNNVVLCNAAMAIHTIHPNFSYGDCYYEAEESLLNGKALQSFEKLIQIANA